MNFIKKKVMNCKIKLINKFILHILKNIIRIIRIFNILGRIPKKLYRKIFKKKNL